jgi:hypothetical protein
LGERRTNVIKTLVAVEVDLASSFAIRYACRLGNHIEMELHPVYVKSAPLREEITGVGWAPRTWQRELVQAGREEIQAVLSPEAESCPALREPRVIYGDRGAELAKIVEQETFDLYVEGAPYPFDPGTIHKALHSKFHQRLPCPFIWLRGLRKIDRVLVLSLDAPGAGALARAFGRIFAGCQVPLHLAFPALEGADETNRVREAVSRAAGELEASGCRVTVEEPFQPVRGAPSPEMVNTWGLVAVTVSKAINKDSPQLKWLAEVRAPLMLVPG